MDVMTLASAPSESLLHSVLTWLEVYVVGDWVGVSKSVHAAQDPEQTCRCFRRRTERACDMEEGCTTMYKGTCLPEAISEW